MVLIEVLYVLCALLPSLYAFNSLVLTWLYLRRRRDPIPDPPPLSTWPTVTVQLPVFNEQHTVERLLAAVAALDYPRDRFEVQVLDDSTDETRALVAQAVEQLRAQGIEAVQVTRTKRTGYKAGALAHGMDRSRGELIALFDADFCPAPGFLRQVVPQFGDPRVGCVQARWGHVNRDYTLLTEAEALSVDGHFVVEQTARSRAGLFLNFNGSAGVWRRAAIEDAGGWSADTLTEDLDLSYRAQLRGWRIVYLPDVVVPAELPVQIGAFRQQQARWAQGSIRTAFKLIGPLLRSRHSWAVKLQGVIHLTSYFAHPSLFCLTLLSLFVRPTGSWVSLLAPWLLVAAAGPPVLYLVALVTGVPSWRRRLRALPILILLGTGISLSNTRAAWWAMLGRREHFRRTPKFAVRRSGEAWQSSAYALRVDVLTWAELALALLAFASLALPGARGLVSPWLLLQASAFAFVSCTALWQAWRRRRWLARQPRPGAGTTVRTPAHERERIPPA